MMNKNFSWKHFDNDINLDVDLDSYNKNSTCFWFYFSLQAAIEIWTFHAFF